MLFRSYKPVQLDAQGRAVRLGAQGKAEQRLGGVEWLGGAEWRLGGVGEAAELCGAAELLGVPLTWTMRNLPLFFSTTNHCDQYED